MSVQNIEPPLDLSFLLPFEAPSDGRYETKDFRPFARSAGVDKLIIIYIRAIGTTRPYYGFLPLGPPKAFCIFGGEMIDANTNKLIWLRTMTAVLGIPGNWDNPPNFPEVTSEIQNALKMASVGVKQSFFDPGSAIPAQ
jgi:hypothetical protein